jgi:effector-binding domain-containing protein
VLLSGFVAHEVRTQMADPRPLAAIRSLTPRQRLGTDIIRLLDVIWPVLRGQGVSTGHNVVIYYGESDGTLTIDVGVEVPAGFDAGPEVSQASTPAGEVATTAHYGEYSDLGQAYTALNEWCACHGRRAAGVNWEVYGDWADDPARRRTDVFFLLTPPQADRRAPGRGA